MTDNSDKSKQLSISEAEMLEKLEQHRMQLSQLEERLFSLR